jgi:hypothetical protein
MNEARRESTHTIGDYAYDAIYVGGIGGGLVALFFLVFDVVVHGEALFTPSLMGSVLFGGISPNAVQTVDMIAVAKYTAVHFLAFGLLGFGISFITHQAEIRSRHPVLVIGLVFLVLEVGFWLAASLVIPGVIRRLGALPVAAANLLAAIGIALFLAFTHRPELWLRVRRALHLARPA